MSMLEPDLGSYTPQSLPTLDPIRPKSIGQFVAPTPEFLNQQVQSPTSPIDTTGLDTTAVIPNLPTVQKQFVTKYQRLTPQLANLDPKIKAGLVKVDLARVNKGQAPLNDKETLAAIVANLTGEAVTKPAENKGILDTITSIPGKVVSDAGTILKSLPHLLTPNRGNPLYKEAMEIPHLGERYQEGIDAGLNPVAAFANVPIARMVPGAFVVGNVAQGTKGIRQLADHPLMTTLDVLPYASKLAKTTTVGKTAALEAGESAFEAGRARALAKGATADEAVAAGEKASIKASSASHPLRALATKRLIEGGVDPLTGSALELRPWAARVAERTAESTLGKMVADTWSKNARAVSGEVGIAEARFADVRTGITPVTDTLESTVRDAVEARVKESTGKFDIAPERIPELAKAYELDRRVIDTLPADEAAYLRSLDDIGRRVTNEQLGLGELTRLGNGEIYPAKVAKKITKAGDTLTKAVAKFSQESAGRIQAILDDEVLQADSIPQVGARLKAQQRVYELQSVIDDALDPKSPTKWSDVNSKINGMNMAKTSIASPGTIGEGIGAATSEARVGTLAKLQREVKTLAKLESKAAEKEATVPARFYPVIQELAKDKATEGLILKGVDPAVAAEVVLKRQFDLIPEFTEKYLNRTVDEVAKTWQELKEAGHDPGWVHHVTAGREGGVNFPKLTDRSPTLTAAMERNIYNPAPSYGSIAVGLDHAATELLRKRISAETMGSLMEQYAFSKADLESALMPRALKAAERNPLSSPELELGKLMSKEFSPFKAEEYAGTQIPGINPDKMYIPKSMARNMRRIFDPKENSFLNTFDPITNTFRVSVLALSPRWHVYNVINNAMQIMANDPRAFAQIVKARKAIAEVKAGSTALPEELRFGLGTAAQELHADAAAWMKGREAGGALQRFGEGMIGRAGKKVVEKSYDLNAWFDDATKVAAYMQGEKNALGKLYAPEAARTVGMESARKVSQFWNELTPIERNVIRKVFPFYAWTSKVMRLVTSYPMDHPVRAAILSNFAEAEMADIGNGLPGDWLDSIAIGGEDKYGNQKRLNLSGLNPFSDTANLFTIQGFAAGVNPLIATGLQQLGVEKGGGGFGNSTYDPATGKLTDAKPGLVGSLIGNVVPQLGSVERMTGGDAEYNALLRTNPDAAKRLLASGLGLPTLGRNVNEAEVRIKTEMARQSAQRDAWSNALKTGDFSEAEKYPALRPNIEKLKKLLASGQLSAYNPMAGAEGGIAGAGNAVASQAPWPT